MRKQRPWQSTQTISFSGSTEAVCLTLRRARCLAHYDVRVRVVAGTLRGRTIVAPSGSATRPTTDRTREAMFNALASLGVLEDASVMDVFAGSGALGIEALSRGARRCVFVEADHKALSAIHQNVKALGLEDRTEIVAGRAENVMSSIHGVDLALVDPPYGYDRWSELLAKLEETLNRDGLVVVESGSQIEESVLDSTWTAVRSKRYGRTWVTFLQRV